MENENVVRVLNLALAYLEHPDVQAIPFAVRAEVAAEQVKQAIADLDYKTFSCEKA